MSRFAIAVISFVLMGTLFVSSIFAVTIEVRATVAYNSANGRPKKPTSNIPSENHFTTPPNADTDIIQVKGDNKGAACGTFPDIYGDGARLKWETTKEATPVRVTVVGREGIGAYYWVMVDPAGGAGGGVHGGPTTDHRVLRADVQDYMKTGTLYLRDKVSASEHASDETDSNADAPKIYTTLNNEGKGDVYFWLSESVGVFYWEIKRGNEANGYHDILVSGYLTATEYKPDPDDLTGLDPGQYELTVTPVTDAEIGDRCIKFSVVKVAYDQELVHTGYVNAEFPPDPPPVKKVVTATVVPKEEIGIVDAQVRNLSNNSNLPTDAFVHRADKNTENGTIAIQVVGLHGTPNDKPGGSCYLEATCRQARVGKVNVVVHVPKFIGIAPANPGDPLPLPSADVDVDPFNLVGSRTSVPPIVDAPEGQAVLVTVWVANLTMPVLDQWKNPLPGVYQGTSVEELYYEKVGADWFDIFQPISAAGTYTDPVGLFVWDTPLTYVDPTSEEAELWPITGDPLPLVNDEKLQHIKVRVAGHEIPRPIKRMVYTTTPAHVRIVNQ